MWGKKLLEHLRLNIQDNTGKIKVKQLVYVFGLKRSGLHAISFWLLGHKHSNALINNSPAKRPGEGSPMSRTIQNSPLPLSIHQGKKVSFYKKGAEKYIELPSKLDLLVVLFQSQHLWHLKAHEPLIEGVEASNIKQILLLRDPFNWAASYIEKSQHPDASGVFPKQWQEYADEYVGKTNYFPDAVKINYNRWFVEKSYRQQISEQLGFRFTDKGLEVITSHGGGSSFEGREFHQNAQQMGVTERWLLYQNNQDYVQAFKQSPELIELARDIFDLSPELASFAAQCQGTN